MMKRMLLLVLILCAVFMMVSAEDVDYSDLVNWAFAELEDGEKADVFFIAPTATTGNAENLYWIDFENQTYYDKFVGAIAMQKDLYDDADTRFFSPLYHQVFLMGSYEPEEVYAALQDNAYADVKASFQYYLDYWNDGRPIILAGFSQGSYMCMRLLKDFFADEDLNEQLVACYAIGWCVTEEELAQYPFLHFAAGELDTGVIITFSSEAEFIESTQILPAGVKTLAINPLNWRTDGERADASLNLGACFLDTAGNVLSEIPALTGAYIDETRGALKVPDVSPEDYPARLKGYEEGVYHCYDYQFFYRNIQQNVRDRLDCYLNK